MLVPLDEYPIHQVARSMGDVFTSDRNFYDRCYLNAHDRTGEVFLVTGLGVYPNLGVIDAYATVRRGDEQISIRTSDALGPDRMKQSVGPYRIEVLEELHSLRVVCDADAQGIGFDLTWTGAFPAIAEDPHVMRQGPKVILDALRFAQVGNWAGELRVRGEVFTVTPDVWVGTRDRSWGIRPVGEAEPPGRQAAEGMGDFGMWWTYVPMQFPDFGLVVIVQEDPDGNRSLNQAVRVWPDRAPEQLGWPRIDVRYKPGTRQALGATLELATRDGKPVVVEVQTLGHVALNCGPGYGGDPDWAHGQWKGRGFLEGGVVDMTEPAAAGRAGFSVIDYVARASCDGAEGWGLFEHACIGRYDPSGFTDFFSVAP